MRGQSETVISNPLEATTPEALFGAEALADARQLKRVYARLIRVHTPEQAPEVFAHIRCLYEQAQSSLAEGTPRCYSGQLA